MGFISNILAAYLSLSTNIDVSSNERNDIGITSDSSSPCDAGER